MSPKLSNSLAALLATAVFAVCIVAQPASATIYYAATNGLSSNSGLSWSVPRTFQSALTGAKAGDQVWVKAGTYTAAYTATDGVAVYGSFAGTETSVSQRNISANPTILDGGGMITPYSIPSAAKATNTFDGFTVQHGYATAMAGGLIDAAADTLQVANCDFASNKGFQGGAVYAYNDTSSYTNCSFNSNNADTGGALYVNIVSMTTCTFSSNNTNYNSYGAAAGAIFALRDVRMTKCNCSNNVAPSAPQHRGSGGVLFDYSGQVTVSDCTFSGNSPDSLALYTTGTSVSAPSEVKDCLFVGSGTGTSDSDAIHLATQGFRYDSYIVIANDTFADFSTCITIGDPGIAIDGTVSLANSIFSDNYGSVETNDTPTPTFSSSHNDNYDNVGFNYMGVSTSASDLTVDPDFVDAATGNYQLNAGSPLINAGNDNYVSLGDTDLLGDPRIEGSYVDIGCYEFVPGTPSKHRFDFNLDGLDDLLFQNSNGQTLVWDMNGQAIKTTGATFTTVAPPWDTAAVADINADGHPDLLWWNSLTGQCLFWEMTGTLGTTVLQYEPSFASISDTHWHPVSMADLDGNGHPDILWENFSTGQLLIWYMNGNTIKKYGSAFATLPANWIIAGTADFNLDGHPDLLLENTKTGQVLVWYLTGALGTTILSYGATFATVSDTNFSVVSTGDMNGDGHPDLTWHDKSTGATEVWLMGGSLGTTVTSYGGNIGSVPTTWSIVGVH